MERNSLEDHTGLLSTSTCQTCMDELVNLIRDQHLEIVLIMEEQDYKFPFVI